MRVEAEAPWRVEAGGGVRPPEAGTRTAEHAAEAGTRLGSWGRVPPRRAASRDEGQMLILAGAVLVLSFLLAALSVTELSAQEIALEQDPEGKLATTFHETRDELTQALQGLVLPQTTNGTLYGYFASQKAEFEERGRAHGLYVVLGMGNETQITNGDHLETVATQSEKRHMTSGGAASTCNDDSDLYTVWAYDGSRNYNAVKWDCGDDGILWDDILPRDDGAGEIRGIAVYLVMASETARIEENFVIALN